MFEKIMENNIVIPKNGMSCTKQSKKSSRNEGLAAVLNIGSSDCEVSFKDNLFHKKKKKGKSSEDLLIEKKDITYNQENKTNNFFKKPKKSKKYKNTETLVDIRDSDCEMSVGVNHKRKKKKKIQLEDEFRNILERTSQKKNGDIFNDHIQYDDDAETNKVSSSFKAPKKLCETIDNFGASNCDVTFSEISCQKKKKKKKIRNIDFNQKNITPNQENEANNSFKKSKKHKNVESSIDIRDSDCEMSVDILNHKRRKTKKIILGDDINGHIEHDGVEINNTSASFKSPKKLNETNYRFEYSDCDVSLSDASSCKKRKYKNEYDILNQREVTSSRETDTNSLKKSKKPKNVEPLIDIRCNDRETSVDISMLERKFRKKNDTFNDHVEVEDDGLETFDFIACDESFSGESCHKKKKKKSKNINNHILNEKEVTSSQENETINFFKKSKKSKKHKNVERLIDIRDSDCEMSVDDLTRKRKKKKKEYNLQNILERTTQTGNGDDNYHNDVAETNNTSSRFKSSKKLRKENGDFEIFEFIDCNVSLSEVPCPKKKKKTPKNRNKDILNKKEITSSQENGTINFKKLKTHNNVKSSIDIRDSEREMSFGVLSHDIKNSNCDMSVSDVSSRKKKKKSLENRNNYMECESDEEIIKDRNIDMSSSVLPPSSKKRKYIEDSNCDTSAGVLNRDINNSICDLSVDVSSRKKKKKSLENRNKYMECESDKEITKTLNNDSYCEMSADDVSYHKEKNKKNITHDETLKMEENICHSDVKQTNNQANSFKSSKKPKGKNNFLMDIRGSKYWLTTSNDGSYKQKKKQKRKNFENIDVIKNEYDDDTYINELNNEVPNCKTNAIEKVPKTKESIAQNANGNTFNRYIEQEINSCSVESPQNPNNDPAHDYDKTSIKREENDTLILEKNLKKCDNRDETDVTLWDTGESDSIISDQVTINTNDFISHLKPEILDLKDETFPQSSFPENSPQNLGNHDDMENFDEPENKMFSRYSMIYTSSSEGYQSDSSEITNPSKKSRKSDNANSSDNSNNILQRDFSLEGLNETCDSKQYVDADDADDTFTEEISGAKGRKPRSWKEMRSKFVKDYEANAEQITPTDETSAILKESIKEAPSEDDLETVSELNIVCNFPICILHSILTRSTLPSQAQLQTIKELKLEVKSGRFIKEEDRTILVNWKAFCENYKLPMKPSLFVPMPRKMRQSTKTNFLRHLARGLDNRMLHRVYARFETLFQGYLFKTGRFSAEEDETILNHMNRVSSSAPFAYLSQLLNRTRMSIIKRHDLLIKNKDQTPISWTPDMVDKLVACMKKVTKCDEVEELKDRKLTDKEWKRLSKKMDNIPVKKLQRGWHATIYPKLFVANIDAAKVKSIKMEIIRHLYEKKETEWKMIDWVNIAKKYDGFTPEKIYSMVKHTVNYHVPDTKRENLEDCLDFLVNQVFVYGNLSTTHKVKSFEYKEGHIVVKNEGVGKQS